ncbi:hypothetical protein QTJ16_004767 [Diplocarpon rosae]|uniref:G-patch domain-containing protein n=1 Tax=Diplocarpon rosae TaxID=946125 RepID=A0AAD9WBH8_9HELO|nr:hypothetical protein QTJ16_004767 [Diplocarpon rosae]PBP24215.1 DNA-directed RNA polymerase II subunit RPB1 [Diplocarpon rosae]
MDAHALLTSQGWRGTGNSLHPTNNSIGLSRPLLVSKKVDNLGIGKKQHRTSDMWWMNAFDSSLKGLDTSKEGKVTQTVTSGGLDMVQKAGAKWVGSKGGLYASFVRGEMLGGTIEEIAEISTGSESGGAKKRKREEGETKEERRERKASRKAARAERVQQLVIEASKSNEKMVGSNDDLETKKERKARRAAKKRALREQESRPAKELSEDVKMEDAETPETKEERKERRRLKKLAKDILHNEKGASPEKSKKKKRRKE